MGSSDCELNDDSATVSEDTSATKTDSETETDDERSSRFLPFEQHEKVLALYGDTWYHAKVRAVKYREKEPPYLVHYLGWKEKWDEWIGADRLMKFNEDNLKKCNALPPKWELEGNLPAGRVLQRKSECHSDGRGRKRKIDSFSLAHTHLSLRDALEEKGAITSEKLMNLHIPPRLKKQLTDDCDFITHLGKLVKLPRTPSVNDIIEKKYIDYRSNKDGRVSAAVQEFAKGLENYFNQSLPLALLYKSEHQQYTDAIRDFIEPSTVYGAEHLLRLFVKLPNTLARSELEEETLSVFHKEVVHFLKFLQKHQNEFFLSNYHVPEESETSTNKQEV